MFTVDVKQQCNKKINKRPIGENNGAVLVVCKKVEGKKKKKKKKKDLVSLLLNKYSCNFADLYLLPIWIQARKFIYSWCSQQAYSLSEFM